MEHISRALERLLSLARQQAPFVGHPRYDNSNSSRAAVVFREVDLYPSQFDLFTNPRTQTMVELQQGQEVTSFLHLPSGCTWQTSDIVVTAPTGNMGLFQVTVPKWVPA
jgi:hypothetical protein